jgi:carboxymethylenebutenolidase
MRRLFVLLIVVIGVALRVGAQEHTEHMMLEKKTPAAVQEKDPKLPASDEGAKAVLEQSPRHAEWADVKYEGGEHPIKTFVVYPERKDKAPVVIVIHEIYGLTDWIRAVADQLAADGYIAVAPDLISGMGPGGGGTESVPSRDEVVRLIRSLSPDQVATQLNAVREYAVKLPSANGKSATVGYCWGGSRSFESAARVKGLNAAIVYYGSSPDSTTLANIQAPVLGLYGGDDARVNATIEPAVVVLKKLGKHFEYEIYEGAGHGFLRAQSGREGANMRATQKVWPRMLEFLKKHM